MSLADAHLGLVDRATVLVVDDTPANLSLLAAVLKDDYRVKLASSGERALDLVAAAPPDLILLDVMMPGLSGYEVCAQLKADPATRDIPVIFVTAMADVEDEERGFTLGAVDYITKPISPPIVRVRVKTCLQLREQACELHRLVDQLQVQADELRRWNLTLESRVAAGVEETERLTRLKRFFSPSVVDLIVGGKAEDIQQTRRREIVVVFLDIRGYTAFTETADPEDVMAILGTFHAEMGRLIMAYGATLERFGGDSIMVFFNDPMPVPDAALQACRMAVEMQQSLVMLTRTWRRQGFELSVAIGIAQGYATVGMIGFEGRRDYGAIGTVTNLAARLCSEGQGGQILVSQRVQAQVDDQLAVRPIGELQLKGFHRPVPAFEVLPT
jgi:class 3 adenylate cyclase/AmiR/NasT family two-component response regulator